MQIGPLITTYNYTQRVGMWRSWLERRTVTPLTQVRFPGAARDFLPRVNFQCRLSYGVRTPPCAIACINICAHDKHPVVHVKSSVDYGHTKTPSMHCRLGSTSLSQLVFPGVGNPNFPWKKFQWDDAVEKILTLNRIQ